MKNTVSVGRYGKEGKLKASAIFLGSEEASYVTGVILPIDEDIQLFKRTISSFF